MTNYLSMLGAGGDHSRPIMPIHKLSLIQSLDHDWTKMYVHEAIMTH